MNYRKPFGKETVTRSTRKATICLVRSLQTDLSTCSLQTDLSTCKHWASSSERVGSNGAVKHPHSRRSLYGRECAG